MDILHLTPEAHELLQNWGEENRLLVDSVLPYNKSYFKKAVFGLRFSVYVGF